jgi:hypothetical protein
MVQHDAILYLAALRGETKIKENRSLHTFNFGTYQLPHRTPPGWLLAIHDETIVSGSDSINYPTADCMIVLVPLEGVATFYPMGIPQELQPGFVGCVDYKGFEPIRVHNTGREIARFLHLQFALPGAAEEQSYPPTFEITSPEGELMVVSTSATLPSLSFGTYAGRQEGTYRCTKPDAEVFVFVIHGAFEVQHILMEACDGLLLRKQYEIEFEALSNGASLVIAEKPRVHA